MNSFFESEVAAIAVFLALPLFVLVLAIIIFAGREPDTTGRRAFAVYLAAVSFVAIFTAVFASFAAVVSLADLIVDGRSEDAAVRGAVQAGLVVAAALVVLVFHARRRRELQLTEAYDVGAPPRAPGGRRPADLADLARARRTLCLPAVVARGGGRVGLASQTGNLRSPRKTARVIARPGYPIGARAPRCRTIVDGCGFCVRRRRAHPDAPHPGRLVTVRPKLRPRAMTMSPCRRAMSA